MATEHRPADSGSTGGRTDGPAAGDTTLPAAADPAVVGPWLAEELGEPRWSPCRVARIGAGRSNLTFRVDSAAGSVVLRRPPLGAIAAGTHDMGREQRALRALQGSAVPVPAVLTGCDESGPLGVPCYVMELIEGVVATGELPAGFAERPEQRRDLGYGLLDVLARLHSIDPAVVGLADFGQPDGFLERQLRRWSRQLDTWRDGHDWPALTELAATLQARLPEPGPATIVHGDYRIDNVVLDRTEPGRVLAVLDWEMATLGDPLADLGLMLVSWQQAEEQDQVWTAAQVLPSPTVLPGFPTRAQAAAHYARRSGRSIRQLPWYIAFGCFKLAVVLVGVLSRARTGAMPVDTATGCQRGITPLALLGGHVVHTERY